MERIPLIDEVVVIDSDSADGTAAAAAKAGAAADGARDIAPELGGYPGKGEALWKSLLVAEGDLLVFIDADLTQWGPHFASPLLQQFVREGAQVRPVARPIPVQERPPVAGLLSGRPSGREHCRR